jgi:hypothetical protein
LIREWLLCCHSCFVQLTHETCDSICGRQGPRHEHYGKLVTIGNWQQFEREFIELVRQSATATEGTKLKVGFYMPVSLVDFHRELE